jgi:Squalene-hopene cyclase C-terminal domain
MGLNFDPFQIFQNSRTPAGLYARKKWLDQGREKGWQKDYNKTVSDLLKGQEGNGSWDQSPLRTIRRLFGLHLTVRERTAPIEKSLHWLLEYCMAQFPKKRLLLDDRLTCQVLHDLPFSPGCSGYFLYGATLFLSSIFGMEKEERVLFMYQALAETGIKNKGRWCGLSCTNNILRAFIVHPDFTSHKATKRAVEALAHEQEPSGSWKRPIPFYQTVNALAHLNLKSAEAQLKAAFKRVYRSQNRDGTWGRVNREWNTFLVVHALKNYGSSPN